MRRFLSRMTVFVVAATVSVSVSADWINLTGAETSPNIAEITVLEDRVNVRLEIFIRDLEVFQDLIPDQMWKNEGAGRDSQTRRLERFARDVLRVEDPSGEPLAVDLLTVEPRLRVDRKSPFAGMINPQTRRRVPDAPEDKRVLFAELEYRFSGEPDHLTIKPPLSKSGVPRVTIGFIAYHKTVPVIDFRYLSAAARLNLDWTDPWYSRFDNPNLKRHHKNALMSFLYVEPREVRHEVLIRVRDLENWTPLALPESGLLSGEGAAQVKQQAIEFFKGRNPVRIDGRVVSPEQVTAEFLSITLSGLRVMEPDQTMDVATAIVGVILYYPVPQLPQYVDVTWELFNERLGRIPTSMIDPAGPLTSFVDASSPTIEWQNFLLKFEEPKVSPVKVATGEIAVPRWTLLLLVLAVVALFLAIRARRRARTAWAAVLVACVVSAALLRTTAPVQVPNPFQRVPKSEESSTVISGVLDNIHAAYLERSDTALTGALNAFVVASRLGEVRSELDRALAIKVQGGITARVREVADLAVTEIQPTESGGGFRSVSEWTALATAGHWGHAHARRLRFRALIEVEPLDGVWRLGGITVLDIRDAG